MRLLAIILLLSTCPVLGQNLVINPSFEDTVFCPIGLSTMGSAVGWNSPSTASPDHFHTCNTGILGVPQNGFGWQQARTGIAYMGGHTSMFSTSNYREYIQGQLTSPLQAGEEYEVTFYVSRADSATKACDHIGAYLSPTLIWVNNGEYFTNTPQVVSPLNNPITNNIDWVKISDTITAVGGEQYIIIGVFANNATVNWIPVSGGWEDEAHYYYDDVSVVLVNPNGIDELPSSSVSIHPNPTTGQLSISLEEASTGVLSIRNYLGQMIKQEEFSSIQELNISLNGPSGLYFLQLEIDGEIITKKVVKE